VESLTNGTLDRTLFDALPIPAFIVDFNVRILALNSAAARFVDNKDLRTVFDGLAGEVFHCLYSTFSPEGCGTSPYCQQCVIRNSVANCLEGQAVSRARTRMDFLPETGRKSMELLITANPMPNSSERLALLMIEDITENEELEHALRRSEKLAIAGRYSATIAHEINNPLESLGNILHLLGSQPRLETDAKELVELAMQEVEHLTKISRQTLAPHRETESQVATKLSSLLDDVVDRFHRRLESAQIKVLRKYQTEEEVLIFPSEFQQVFANLLTNAIDAIEKRGELHLSIETLPENEVVVKVADSGCGIASENLDAIFQPFFTKGEKGTGIGLWVIKRIIDKAGGRIEVASSTVGKTGTCFSIFLPVSKVPSAL
jgi:signal transduction histidine kinase